VADRVAQMVVTMTLEPAVAPIFLPDSYGYRPGKSALDAVAVTRTRCWKYDWVLEFDIKGLFDHTCRYPPQQPVGLGNWRIWISPAQS
jgi:RNA-directed DNA polymerase